MTSVKLWENVNIYTCMYKVRFPLPIRSTKRRKHDFFLTSSRLQTRPQIDQLDLCSIAARFSPDPIGLQSDIIPVEVWMIGYKSGTHWVNFTNPTKTRSLHECFSVNSIFYSTNKRSLLDRFSSASRWAWLLYPTRHVKNIRVGRPSDADQDIPSRPLPITHTDRARPVPGYLMQSSHCRSTRSSPIKYNYNH